MGSHVALHPVRVPMSMLLTGSGSGAVTSREVSRQQRSTRKNRKGDGGARRSLCHLLPIVNYLQGGNFA